MTTTSTPQEVFGKAYGGNAPENYERYFVPAIGGPLAADLIAAARLGSGERVLDVACGTGIVARLAADCVGTSGAVAGVDVNAAMLAVARSVAAAARTPIQWYETSAEAMPLPDEAFDVVFCQLGLQFVPDKRAAVSEMRRVLVARGRAYVTVPTPTRFFDVLDDALTRQAVPTAAAFVRLVFSMDDASELERLFRSAGFGEVDIRSETKRLRLPRPEEFLSQYIQSTPLAGAITQLDDKRRAALERDVVAGWQEWVEDSGMTYAQEILVAAARK
jgi:ubiquinone/menaquinone biosynthesis C-methylase UbiE